MRPKRDEGVVLLLVLVILVATVSTVYAFTRTATLEVLSSRQRSERTRAELLARSGERVAVRALLDDLEFGDDLTVALETQRDDWHLLTQEPVEVPGGGVLRFGIQDAGSRINLNALVDSGGRARPQSLPFLKAALERVIEMMPGRSEDKPYDAEAVATAILDWVDADEQTLSFGDDEARTYAPAEGEPVPPNRPLFAIDELLDVPGVDALLVRALEDYFTASPMYPSIEQGGVNPNTAPPHVLGLVFHYQSNADDGRLFGRDEVFRILQFRAEDRLFCPEGSDEEGCESFAAHMQVFGEVIFPPLQFASDVFRIDVEASYGETRACVSRVVDRRDREPRTLAYRVDC